MTLLIVRHARAGERRAWDGDDAKRPLSKRGLKQAGALAKTLAPFEPKRIYSSPTVRCTQTVEPLARALGIDVEDEQRLFEGPKHKDIASLVDDLSRKRTHVVCTHGDVIPALLEELTDRGMSVDGRYQWQKASTWVVEYSKDTGWGRAEYLEPPDKT